MGKATSLFTSSLVLEVVFLDTTTYDGRLTAWLAPGYFIVTCSSSAAAAAPSYGVGAKPYCTIIPVCLQHFANGSMDGTAVQLVWQWVPSLQLFTLLRGWNWNPKRFPALRVLGSPSPSPLQLMEWPWWFWEQWNAEHVFTCHLILTLLSANKVTHTHTI